MLVVPELLLDGLGLLTTSLLGVTVGDKNFPDPVCLYRAGASHAEGLQVFRVDEIATPEFLFGVEGLEFGRVLSPQVYPFEGQEVLQLLKVDVLPVRGHLNL